MPDLGRTFPFSTLMLTLTVVLAAALGVRVVLLPDPPVAAARHPTSPTHRTPGPSSSPASSAATGVYRARRSVGVEELKCQLRQ